MTKDQIKDYIVKFITDRQGCKAMELALDYTILSEITPDKPYRKSAEKFDIMQLMEELVAERKIVEVEYVLPLMDYRIKSFYLPANTKVSVFPKSSTEADA